MSLKQGISETSPIQEYFLARSQFYLFLQILFYEPLEPDTFTQIQENIHFDELESDGADLIQTFFQAPLSEDQLLKEADEFQRLFVGPDTIIAPLWESYYRSKDGLLFGETTLQVRDQYHRFGQQFSKENNEPDDHLTVELEFMLFLIKHSLTPSGSVDFESIEGQNYFLTHHLSQWIPMLCKRIIENTESDLYKGAALLLHQLIIDDLDFFKELEALSHEGNY
jgi:putative dimethyl sulfoxide reductase chaperone